MEYKLNNVPFRNNVFNLIYASAALIANFGFRLKQTEQSGNFIVTPCHLPVLK